MLFLETEWADTAPDGCQLVSIGLVGRDDRFVFYAERDPLPAAPDFVRRKVYPLLERGPFAMSEAAMSRALGDFIARVADATQETPTIAHDHWNDRVMFRNAWLGSDHSAVEVRSPAVEWFELDNLNPHFFLALEDYFEANAHARTRRHHALVDARAARAAYLEAVRQIAAQRGGA